MPTKSYKPHTPGLRTRIVRDYSLLSDTEPYKPLTTHKKRISGRNNAGRISVRRRGGGTKKLLRAIDFKREKFEVSALVKTIEYDPNRSADICLLAYSDGEKRYILAPKGLKIGDTVVSSTKSTEPQPGNSMTLEHMPLGTIVHAVELQPKQGAKLARGAGTYISVVAKDKDYVSLRMPSGEVRMVHKLCRATVGSVGAEDHFNISLGKAGMSRIKGRRPKVRGVVMNPVDHPHGGGEGRTSGGRHPVSPTGVPTKGYRTRNKRNVSSKFIIRRRKK